jgi:hypothetical protein
VLAAVGFGALTYGMVEGAAHGFASHWWAFLVAGVALAGFAVVETRVAEPMLPLTLFRRRNLAFSNLETFLVYGSLGGFFFFFTIYLQFLGFSPLEAGLANVPGSVMMILFSARFGRLADEHGPRLFLTVGPVLVGGGLVLFSLMEEFDDFWRYGIVGLAVFSFGLAMLVAPITSTALQSAPTRYTGIASGLNQTVSRVGNLLAVATLGFVVLLVYEANGGDTGVALARHQHDPTLHSASVAAFRAAMLVAAGLAFAGAIVAWFGISNQEARLSQEDTTVADTAGV